MLSLLTKYDIIILCVHIIHFIYRKVDFFL